MSSTNNGNATVVETDSGINILLENFTGLLVIATETDGNSSNIKTKTNGDNKDDVSSVLLDDDDTTVSPLKTPASQPERKLAKPSKSIVPSAIVPSPKKTAKQTALLLSSSPSLSPSLSPPSSPSLLDSASDTDDYDDVSVMLPKRLNTRSLARMDAPGDNEPEEVIRGFS